MKNRKNRYRRNVTVIAATLLIILLFKFASDKEKLEVNRVKYINSSAKVIDFFDFNDLETSAELIVSGTKVSVEKQYIERDGMGDVIGYGTKSAIKINKVIKSRNKEITIGKYITVLESGATEQTNKGTLVYGMEGYQLMNEKEEYLLFLDKSLTDPNLYFIKGVYYGKIPLKQPSKGKLQSNGDASPYDFQYKGEVTEKLEQIFTDALIKYKNEYEM